MPTFDHTFVGGEDQYDSLTKVFVGDYVSCYIVDETPEIVLDQRNFYANSEAVLLADELATANRLLSELTGVTWNELA